MNAAGEEDKSGDDNKPPQNRCIPQHDKERGDAGKRKDDVKPGSSPETQFHDKRNGIQVGAYGGDGTQDSDRCYKKDDILFYFTPGK